MKFALPLNVVALVFLTAFPQLSTAAPTPVVTKLRNALPPLTTNAVPQSVYVVPVSEADGCDPFFPKSNRLRSGSAKQAAAPKAPTLKLVYNGLSGTADRQFAIINGRTLAEGEETEIISGNGRIKIRCIQIKGETVIVEAQGERRELQLGSGK
jgi:hypothetical protein